MSLNGNAAHAIITKGLTCGQTTACQSGSLLTAGPFTLFCVNPVEENKGGGGGGYWPTIARPLQPGEIHQLYQPLPDNQQYLIIPRDKEAEYLRRYIPVTITMKIGNINVEKQYVVPQTRAKVIFKTITVANTTRDKMKIAISNLKRRTTSAIVKVTNFILRRSD